MPPRLDPTDPPEALRAAKAVARARALAARDALSSACRAGAGARVAAYADAISLPPNAIVAGFLPIRTEIDPRPLMDRLSARGARLALPAMADEVTLHFRAWTPGDPLVPRVWGIREPDGTAEEVDPDIVLCPLAAFDRLGRRLGHGRGYYDRALARLRATKPVQAIGIAFAVQELEAVPVDSRDQSLDRVLTEEGFVGLLRP